MEGSNLLQLHGFKASKSSPTNIQSVSSAETIPYAFPIAVYRLVHLLKRDDRRDVQSEAALALGIIAFGGPRQAAVVVQANACGQLIQLLGSPSVDVVEVVVLALASIAAGGPWCRDKILDLGVIHALTSLFTPDASIRLLTQVEWCLCILCQDKNPSLVRQASGASVLALHRGLFIGSHDWSSSSHSPSRDSGRIKLVSIASSMNPVDLLLGLH